MTEAEIARFRLVNQQIAVSRCQDPAQVVSFLGAMQAQDYLGTLWAIGLRLPGATENDVERAIADRTIVRTWPLRSTLHFVAAADVHWLLELTAPRILSTARLRFERSGLDAAVLARVRKLLLKTLAGQQQLTRDEIYAVLQRARISVEGQRGYHILWRMGVDRIICFGARRGKQPTFTLLEEWAPQRRRLDRDAALAELTSRYFVGHGPATLQDFVWWSGLKASDAKAGLAMVQPHLVSLTFNGRVYWFSSETPSLSKAAPKVYLLPGFDEYLLGYRDRSASLDPAHAQKVQAGSNGIFLGTIVVNGRVIGTWKRELRKNAARIITNFFRPVARTEAGALEKAISRYCKFLQLEREPQEGETREVRPD
jgi:hypothetical protein